MTEAEKKKLKGMTIKKVIIAVTLDPENIAWVKEWAVRRDRSVSWAINHFVSERRGQDLAEKHLGKKVVR